MKRIIFAFMLSIVMFIVGTGNSIEQYRIAVLDLEAKGTARTTASAVSEMIRTEMINIGMFTVIERNEMGVIMKEQGLSQTGCTDQDCAVQVGKLLSARKILVGTLTQQGTELLISVRVVDVEKGVAEFGESEVASSAKLSDLNTAVSELTSRLSSRISGKRIDKTPTPNAIKSEEKRNSKYTPTNGQEYRIGDRGPAGGWIFYDKGNYSDGWRYLEAAPEDQGQVKWGCRGKEILQSRNRAIGTGKINTVAILQACGESCIVVKLCVDYRGGGKNDWFLPSIEELAQIYTSLYSRSLGSFTDENYWSSSEVYSQNAKTWAPCILLFGGKVSYSKDPSCRVRAVRAF